MIVAWRKGRHGFRPAGHWRSRLPAAGKAVTNAAVAITVTE
jgi:hypothetical protein